MSDIKNVVIIGLALAGKQKTHNVSKVVTVKCSKTICQVSMLPKKSVLSCLLDTESLLL